MRVDARSQANGNVMRTNMKLWSIAILLAFSLADRAPAGGAVTFQQHDGSLAIRNGNGSDGVYTTISNVF
jgi:hypothetical protein